MTQTTIVLIIIALSITYTVFSVVKNLKKKEEEDSSCGDCNGCDIKNEISKKAGQKASKNPSTCGTNRQC